MDKGFNLVSNSIRQHFDNACAEIWNTAKSEDYRDTLLRMNEEELGAEFSSWTNGDFLNEYDWMMEHKGRTFVIEYLVDKYEANQND